MNDPRSVGLEQKSMTLAVVIPCFRVRAHIVEVIKGVLEKVDHVFVVDDCCPEKTGDLVTDTFRSEKLSVLRHSENQGVGGATVTGYKAALSAGYKIIVKIDGDGQMDPENIPNLIWPITAGQADYTKGNRFYRRDYLERMPFTRLIGNSALSLITKVSSGYWNIMDPTNGFTAIHAVAAQEIELEKVARRYFFESDVLFRLNIARAVVKDVPVPAIYGSEKSNLKIWRVLLEFPRMHLRNFLKRLFYTYILRDFNVGSVEALLGSLLFVFGVVFGAAAWTSSALSGRATPIGTVMLATLPVILGFQLLLASVAFDVANVPSEPLQKVFPTARHDAALQRRGSTGSGPFCG